MERLDDEVKDISVRRACDICGFLRMNGLVRDVYEDVTLYVDCYPNAT